MTRVLPQWWSRSHSLLVVCSLVLGFLLGRGSAPEAESAVLSSSRAGELMFGAKPEYNTVLPPAFKLRTRPAGMKTAIIATAVGYSDHEWSRFFVPLRKVYDGDVIVVVDMKQKDNWEWMVKKFNFKPVALDSVSTGVLKGTESTWTRDYTVKRARYEIYSRLCSAGYEWCFATDFRDVFFQADPFGRVPADKDLELSQEWRGFPIRKCHVNSEWITTCWGTDFHKSIGEKPIICSGTILGTPRGFRELAAAMTAEYAVTSRKKGCLSRDQGHLIYLVYSGALERRLPGRVALREPGHGVAMTVGVLEPSSIVRFAARRYVYNADMSPAPVVHQFDRWGILLFMFEWQMVVMSQTDHGGKIPVIEKPIIGGHNLIK